MRGVFTMLSRGTLFRGTVLPEVGSPLGGFIGRDGKSSSVTSPLNTKCTFTRWAPGHMPKRCVQPSTQEGFSLAGGSCRVTRVEVSLPPARGSSYGALTTNHRFDTEEFTTTFSVRYINGSDN